MVVDLLLAKPANVDLSFENSVERFLGVSYEPLQRYLKITSPPLHACYSYAVQRK